MQISFKTESSIDISMSWSGDFSIGGTLFFFSSDKSDLKKAHEMEIMFPNMFTYDFYTEGSKDKVIMKVNEGTRLTIK